VETGEAKKTIGGANPLLENEPIRSKKTPESRGNLRGIFSGEKKRTPLSSDLLKRGGKEGYRERALQKRDPKKCQKSSV